MVILTSRHRVGNLNNEGTTLGSVVCQNYWTNGKNGQIIYWFLYFFGDILCHSFETVPSKGLAHLGLIYTVGPVQHLWNWENSYSSSAQFAMLRRLVDNYWQIMPCRYNGLFWGQLLFQCHANQDLKNWQKKKVHILGFVVLVLCLYLFTALNILLVSWKANHSRLRIHLSDICLCKCAGYGSLVHLRVLGVFILWDFAPETELWHYDKHLL